MPCTTILAGSQATADGSLFISRSEDCSPDDAKRLVWHPARDNAPGEIFLSYREDVTWPLLPRALCYLSIAVSATDGASESEAGFNEAGTGLSATETIYASDRSLALDPYLPLTGVIEDMLEDAVLPHIRSAREGVALLGAMVEKAGAGEGCGVSFIDENEIWWFETCCGHQWAAAKLPPDCCYVTANHARLQEFDPSDPGRFMGSPDLIGFAERNGFWPQGKRPFNVRAAYCDVTAHDAYYNYPRNRVLTEKFRPEVALRPEDDFHFPVFLKPSFPVAFSDIASGLRNRYEGTDSDPYQSGNPRTRWRPISVFRCTHTHILELQPQLPPAVGEITWVAWGMTALAVFVPVFQGVRRFPRAYCAGTHDADMESAGWLFRRVQTLAMTDYPAFSPIVRRVWERWERQARRRVALIRARYCRLAAQSPEEADAYLQAQSDEILEDALRRARALECELMTLLTRKISAAYPFTGA